MHVAFIMDGNRRYAQQNSLMRIFGHKAGVSTLDKILEIAPKYDIDTITVYALSTENLVKRSKEEVEDIFKVMVEAARAYKRKLVGNNIRAKLMGNLSLLPTKFAELIKSLEDETKDCTGQLLQICVGYGGKEEITRAVKQVVANNLEITEENIEKYLDSPLQPDIVIRTGGDVRMSNFLLWQSGYSEWYFTPTLWPDFGENELQQALKAHNPERVNHGK
jgi:undecaprenyl diphosphate synthase